MILLYLIIFQIYNPSKLSPFAIFKEMENPPESLFIILPPQKKHIEVMGGSLNGIGFSILERKYLIKSNSFFVYPQERRYMRIENLFVFYPSFPETILILKNILWNYGKERTRFFLPLSLKFLNIQKYFRVFIKDTMSLFIGENNSFFYRLQTEAGVGFVGTGLIHEFLYGKKRDFFLSPYAFGIFEFKNLLYFYPEIYFDVIRNKFYPGFSFSFSPSPFHLFSLLYEKRSFLVLIPELYDTFLPSFNFKDIFPNLRAFKNEINFLYQARFFEKAYINFGYTWGIYDSISFFEKDTLWKPVIFEHIRINKFKGKIKYQFSNLKFSLNCFFLYSGDFKNYWKNKIVLRVGYNFTHIIPYFELIYPFRFKEPIYKFKICYGLPHSHIYLKVFLRWIRKGIKYYNNYSLNTEAGIGIGIKKD